MRNKKPEAIGKEFELSEIIDKKKWQSIQDNFSAVGGIGLRTVDPQGEFLTVPSGTPRVCRLLLENPELKKIFCGNCLPTFLGGELTLYKNLNFICKAGTCNFVVPLPQLASNEHLGYILVGPVILVARKPKEVYTRIADNLGLDTEDFWSVIQEIKVVSVASIEALVSLIRDVFSYTLLLAQEALPKTGQRRFKPDGVKTNRLLGELLEVAAQICRADVGSVLFFDRNSSVMTIRAAKGLPDKIVKNTRVRRGEGICGYVADQGKPLLISDTVAPNRLKPYLQRPVLGSSMVLPIEVGGRVRGIMNLAALSASKVTFDRENLGLMKKLIGLAKIAVNV